MAKIVSWNINGVRSLPQGLPQTLSSLDADVYCFQETKVTRGALDTSIAFVDGYNSYFGFSRKRQGYSGVATYCKEACSPTDAVEGLCSSYLTKENSSGDSSMSSELFDLSSDELKLLDAEGRAVITRHQLRILNSSTNVDRSIDQESISPNIDDQPIDDRSTTKFLSIINVYCPRLDPEREDRKEFKRNFYRLLQTRARRLLESGDHVLIVGDLNCSHKRIDHCDPDADPEFDESESRKWMNEFLFFGPVVDDENGSSNRNRSSKFIDLFRHFHPDVGKAFTCWRTYTNARAANFGSRIDYAIGDYDLVKSNLIADVEHLVDILGSDHCPVRVTLKNCRLINSKSLPRTCSKFMPEFKGEQQRMHRFLVKRVRTLDDSGANDLLEKSTIGTDQKRSKVAEPKKSIVKKSISASMNLKDYFASATTSRNDDIIDLSTSANDAVSPSSSITSSQSAVSAKEEAASKWQLLFQQPKKDLPLCRGHNEPCVLRTVKKQGSNFNRRFYACARPVGRKDDINAACNYFQWTK